MVSRDWTALDAALAALPAHPPCGTLTVLAAVHGIRPAALSVRLLRLRQAGRAVAAGPGRNRWTAAADRTLAAGLATVPLVPLAAQLGRTPMACFQRALLLGLFEETRE